MQKDVEARSPVYYACYNNDEQIRKNSSSGGIFSALAENIILQNGIVYGAAFNDEWMIEHIRVDNICDLEKLRTSKYVQSNIGMSYRLVQNDLDKGRLVLFTGTPCQVSGLLKFLNGEKYDNLITQDFVCHGVPSPKVWNAYLNYRNQSDGEKTPTNINFRSKRIGWEPYEVEFNYTSGSYNNYFGNDLFMKSFLHNYSLRNSCYNCAFKGINRSSDITLADFWGIGNVFPDTDRSLGISLVIINSKKGKQFFNSIKDKIVYKETDLNDSIKENSSMIYSVVATTERRFFFNNLNIIPFDKLIEQSEKRYNSFYNRLIRKIKNK